MPIIRSDFINHRIVGKYRSTIPETRGLNCQSFHSFIIANKGIVFNISLNERNTQSGCVSGEEDGLFWFLSVKVDHNHVLCSTNYHHKSWLSIFIPGIREIIKFSQINWLRSKM